MTQKTSVSIIGRTELARINEEQVFKLKSQGYRNIDVAKEIGLSKAGVCVILKRLNKRKHT